MANVNKVILIGRLTRDPETRTFNNGGKVVNVGFAVTNRKKNNQTGQWEDDPLFIDISIFNRGENGKLADLVEERCKKGSQVYFEGKLVLDQWKDKNSNENRSKIKMVADIVQLLDPRQQDSDTNGGGGGQRRQYNGGGGGGGGGGRQQTYDPPPEQYVDPNDIPF